MTTTQRTTALALLPTLLALAASLAPGYAATAADEAPAPAPATAFQSLLEPYEGARRALVGDRLEEARESGGELARALEGISGELTAEQAGVPAEKAAEVRALLPELETAAAALAGAGDLAAARDAFYELSKPLVRWRQAAGDGPNVAYCPMAKRSWLQPGDEIGNPYYGSAMATCGSLVD